MAYNKDKSRGMYQKVRATKKPAMPKNEGHDPIEHNGIMPYLNQFLEWGDVHGMSIETHRQRERATRRLIVWCDERNLQRPQDITKPILERYQKYLYYYRKSNGEPLTFNSQYSLLAPIKAFFKYLAKENHILYNPASELDLPRQQRRLPRSVLSIEEVETVLNLIDIKTPYGIRDRAILETLYSTGIRRMECVNLNLYDVDPSRKTLLVREGKGRKDRLLPIGERALQWIELYKLDVRPLLITANDNESLFLTDYGEAWLNNRLSDMVKKYFYHAGIEKTGACHLFRHAMATHMLENGADIRFIQAMLGHSDLSTTQIYTYVSIDKLREIHKATHPAKAEKTDSGNLGELLDQLDDEAEDE